MPSDETCGALVGLVVAVQPITSEAAKAIAACNEKAPDIFFIDYRLPNTTGDNVALAVNENIPKILLTGDLSVSAEYHFDKVMSKPYHFSDIQIELDKLLKR